MKMSFVSKKCIRVRINLLLKWSKKKRCKTNKLDLRYNPNVRKKYNFITFSPKNTQICHKNIAK